MNKTILALFAVFLTLLPAITNAQTVNTTEQYCIDNSTLAMTMKRIVTRNNITNTLTMLENQTCPWGCVNNVCRSPPWITWAIIVGIVFLMVIFYIIFR